jgi:hypothetical protein
VGFSSCQPILGAGAGPLYQLTTPVAQPNREPFGKDDGFLTVKEILLSFTVTELKQLEIEVRLLSKTTVCG